MTILILLFCVWWGCSIRSRTRRPTDVEKARLQSQSQPELTALPVYQPVQDHKSVSCYSIQIPPSDQPDISARLVQITTANQSWADFGKRPSGMFTKLSPLPETPVTETSWSKDTTPASKELPEPRRARLPRNRRSAPILRLSDRLSKVGATAAPRMAFRASRVRHSAVEQSAMQQDRWSWTNSQAPTTPRVHARSLRFSRSSLVSLPQSVSSWLQANIPENEEPVDVKPVEGESAIHFQRKPALQLKNQASRPNLAPLITSGSRLTFVGESSVGTTAASTSMLHRSTSMATVDSSRSLPKTPVATVASAGIVRLAPSPLE